MKLILSDKPIILPETGSDVKIVDLSRLQVRPWIGWFGCWAQPPGKCVIRDDAVRVYPLIARSRKIIYVSKVRYGSYDTVMKTMLERAIPIQQAFIHLVQGETHHVQRQVNVKDAVMIGYGDLTMEEQQVFRQLIERNAKNMNFERWRVRFAIPEELEQVVSEEVAAWERY